MDFIAIPAITVLCYLLSEAYKNFASESLYKHIPVLCGVLGGILGVVCFIWMPDYIVAENALVAAAVGIVSGWAATGGNQVLKQYTNAS